MTLGAFLLRRWDRLSEAPTGHSTKQQTKAKILFARFTGTLIIPLASIINKAAVKAKIVLQCLASGPRKAAHRLG